MKSCRRGRDACGRRAYEDAVASGSMNIRTPLLSTLLDGRFVESGIGQVRVLRVREASAEQREKRHGKDGLQHGHEERLLPPRPKPGQGRGFVSATLVHGCIMSGFAAHDSIGPAHPRRGLIDYRENRAVRSLCRHVFRLALICLLALHALSAAGAALSSSTPVPQPEAAAAWHYVDSYQSASAPDGESCSFTHIGCSPAYCTPQAAVAPSPAIVIAAPHVSFSELARRCSGYIPALESRPPLAFPA